MIATGLLIENMRTADTIKLRIAAEKKRLEESGNISVVVDINTACGRNCRKSR